MSAGLRWLCISFGILKVNGKVIKVWAFHGEGKWINRVRARVIKICIWQRICNEKYLNNYFSLITILFAWHFSPFTFDIIYVWLYWICAQWCKLFRYIVCMHTIFLSLTHPHTNVPTCEKLWVNLCETASEQAWDKTKPKHFLPLCQIF